MEEGSHWRSAATAGDGGAVSVMRRPGRAAGNAGAVLGCGRAASPEAPALRALASGGGLGDAGAVVRVGRLRRMRIGLGASAC